LRIEKDDKFTYNLKTIFRFIAHDSKARAIQFNNSLFNAVNRLPDMPYRYRASYYYDDKKIRDLIFKGYTIPYLIDEARDKIILLDIFKWSEQ
jgi:plasmid stabilization system protein ParE